MTDANVLLVVVLALVAGGGIGFAAGVKVTMRRVKKEKERFNTMAEDITKRVEGIAKDVTQSRESIGRLLQRAQDKDNRITTRDLKLRPLEAKE